MKFYISVLAFLTALTDASFLLADTKPNIIVIYTDDQGYGDVSALNPDAKFKTPNMDRLVHEGIAFTNAHCSDSVCTPSRYSLLTGRYCWRTSRKDGVMGAEGKCLIPDGRMTLASFLRDNGYQTGMVGKWHLGMDFPGDEGARDWSKPVLDMPLDKGFDYYFGIPSSLNYGVLAWFEGRHAVVPPTLFTSKKKNDRHVDYRIKPPYTIPNEASKGEFEVAEDFVDDQCLTRFTDKAIAWMTTKSEGAKQGKPFFLYLPFTSPHYPVCPLPQFQGQGESGAYGEFVIETDYHIGRVLEFLKSSSLDENTLIVFTSDNGPENSWRGRINEFGHDSRGGFREGKRSVYEGGHRVPFVVRWPSGIQQPGRRWNQVVGQTDLLATFADILGKTLPENAGEDSESFVDVLRNPNSSYVRAPLISHGETGRRYAIADSGWKLVMPSGQDPIELYDLSADPSEKKNVANENPERVKSLTEKLTMIVVRGRSSQGAAQSNDTGYWKDLTWITEEQYKDLTR
ncbi:MAG: arylsulfatase [Pirellula sp.]